MEQIIFRRIVIWLNVTRADDSRFGLIGPEAIMGFDEPDDSRFGLIGPEAIMG